MAMQNLRESDVYAKAPERTALEAQGAANDAAIELAAAVCRLADRLVGTVPCGVSESARISSVSGIFGEVESSATRLAGHVSEAFDAMKRIERALPANAQSTQRL